MKNNHALFVLAVQFFWVIDLCLAQEQIVEYRYDLAKLPIAESIALQQEVTGVRFRVVLLPYVIASGNSTISYQYQIHGSAIDDRGSPVVKTASLANSYTSFPEFSLRSDSEILLLTVKTPDGKEYAMMFRNKSSSSLANSVRLPDTLNVDLNNYRDKKLIIRDKPADIQMFEIFKKPVQANKRFFVPASVSITANFIHKPGGYTVYINGEPGDLSLLSNHIRQPGESTLISIVESAPAAERKTRRFNNFAILTPSEQYSFKDSTNLEFVGDAAVQNSLSNPISNPSLPANFGLGAIYSRHNDRLWFNRFLIETFFNISSSLDTVRIQKAPTYSSQVRELGTALLIPSTARQSFILNARFYFNDRPDHIGTYWIERALKQMSGVISGVSIRSTAGNRLWTSYRNSTGVDTTFKVGVASLRIGVFREFLPNTYTHKGYSIIAGIDWDSRTLTGDLRNGEADEVVRDFQQNAIGNTHTRFSGVGFYLTMQLKNIRAGLNYALIYPFESMKFIFPSDFSRKSVFPGLTGGQFAFSVAFTGGFPVRLTNGKD